jgi:hypothetical protein
MSGPELVVRRLGALTFGSSYLITLISLVPGLPLCQLHCHKLIGAKYFNVQSQYRMIMSLKLSSDSSILQSSNNAS